MGVTIDSKVSGDLVGVSTSPQTGSAASQTIDKLIQFDEASVVRVSREAETDETEKTGQIEATNVDVLSKALEGTLTMDKATPDGLAWMLRTFMGAPTTTNPVGTVQQHVFGLESYPDEPDYFTIAHRKGGASAADAAAEYERFIGCAVSQLEVRAAKNEFMTAAASIVGLGLKTEGLLTEINPDGTAGGAGTGASQPTFATTPTSTLQFDPKGTTTAEQAANIDGWVDYDDDGIYELQLDVTSFGAVQLVTWSTTSTSGVSLTTNGHDVRVTYDAQVADVAFKGELNGLSVPAEFKVKAVNLRLYLGAAIDASASKPSQAGTAPALTYPITAGAQAAECELDEFTWTFNRNAEAGRCWRVLDTTESETAQQVELGDVIQRLTFNRRVRDWFVKQNLDANDAFGIHIDAYGGLIETGEPFRVELFFPICKILNATQAAADRKWRDEVEVAILKDNAVAFPNDQPTVAAVIRNAEASYA